LPRFPCWSVLDSPWILTKPTFAALEASQIPFTKPWTGQLGIGCGKHFGQANWNAALGLDRLIWTGQRPIQPGVQNPSGEPDAISSARFAALWGRSAQFPGVCFRPAASLESAPRAQARTDPAHGIHAPQPPLGTPWQTPSTTTSSSSAADPAATSERSAPPSSA
jgi:hypothetical protein